jgi:hypothetical protein
MISAALYGDLIMGSKPAWSHDARTGKVHRHKQLTFFACEGLIVLYDERKQEEDFKVIFPDDFLLRAKHIDRMAKPLKLAATASAREEHRVLKAGAIAMREAVLEAKEMGDPSDPAVQAFWARHRRSSSVMCADPTGYRPPLPGALPRGRNTGRTAAIDGIAGDRNKIYRPPRKRSRTGLILEI